MASLVRWATLAGCLGLGWAAFSGGLLRLAVYGFAMVVWVYAGLILADAWSRE